MTPEITSTIFHKPNAELLTTYASHLKRALDKTKPDGTCVVRTPSGQFRDTETRVRMKALMVCNDLVILGQQATVIELFPSLEGLIEDPIDLQDPSFSPASSQSSDWGTERQDA